MKIAFEGNLGSGKSSLLARICQDLRVPVFMEPVDEWHEWLTQFYKDPVRWGMSFNIKVLLSFLKWKNNDFLALYERSPLSNRHVFAQVQYEQGRMDNMELQLFNELYKELSWFPDVVIYIRTDPETSYTRMQKRGRKCEDHVPIEYLETIHNKYEEVMKGLNNDNCALHMHVVDGNKSADDVYEEVKELVKMYMA